MNTSEFCCGKACEVCRSPKQITKLLICTVRCSWNVAYREALLSNRPVTPLLIHFWRLSKGL